MNPEYYSNHTYNRKERDTTISTNPDSPKTIYIIQMHTGTIPGRLIKLITHYEYSHVVISLDKDCKITYSFGRKKLNNFLCGGFVEEKQNGAFFKKFNKTKCRIYEAKVTHEQHEFLRKLLNYRKKHINDYKYDFAGIVLRFFHIPISFTNRFVCSQFVAEILEKGNIIKFEKPSYFIKTSDFDNCRELIPIYEGLYSEYNV